MAAEAETSAASEPDAPLVSRSFWLFVAVSLAAAGILLLALRLGFGVAIDAPTLALAVACVVLIWTLRGMWGVVSALSRPVAETVVVEAETSFDSSTRAELREEKRRVLRAIKELEFDHAMGKLSDADFKQVGDHYRMRAIEVMRQLDDGGELHPLLVQHLATVGVATVGESATRAAARSTSAAGEASPAATGPAA